MRHEHKSTFTDLLGGRGGLLPIVWVGIGLSVFQQLVGINVIFYYSSSLWQSVGIDPTSSFLYSFTTSIVNIVGTVIAMLFVDRLGRKPLLLTGSIGMSVSLGVGGLGVLLQERQRQEHPPAGRPGHHRARRGAHASSSSSPCRGAWWSGCCSARCSRTGSGPPRWAWPPPRSGSPTGRITVSFPTLSDWDLSGAYMIYACFAVLSIPFVAFLVRGDQGEVAGGDGLTRPPYFLARRSRRGRYWGALWKPSSLL